MKKIEELIASLAQDAAPVKSGAHPYKLSLQWLAAAVAYLALTLAYSGLRPTYCQNSRCLFFWLK